MEDVRERVPARPIFSKDKVDKFLGTDKWIPTQRFQVVQKNTVRGVDSATINGINMASRIQEKIQLPSTDANVSRGVTAPRSCRAVSWTRERHIAKFPFTLITGSGA